MTKRSRRYFFNKKVNKTLYRDLAKKIQEEIDRMIVEQLLEIVRADQELM